MLSAMRIACGFDHAGYVLKSAVLGAVTEAGHEAEDLGTYSEDPVDYPDIAVKVARAVLESRAARGVLVCGSGAGVAVAASKIVGIRAATVHDSYTAHQAVEHDNLNVLCLGARVIGPDLAAELVATFAGAVFSHAPRHERRLGKVSELERRARADVPQTP
jgi:ribose 5-phosphate isomerase B